MPCCLVFCWCGICFGDEGGDVMRFIPCFEHVSIGVQTSPETMPWYQHHWAGLAFGAWIRKCLAPWWPLFKCTKKWWHCWSRVGRIPTTNTLVSMFDFWGGGSLWVYNDISFRAILFSSFWGPGGVGGGGRSASGNSWFDGPVLWDSKGTQQWTTSWREEKLLKNSLPETDSFTGKKGEPIVTWTKHQCSGAKSC